MQSENASAVAGAGEARIVDAPESMREVGLRIVEQLKTVFDPEIPVDIYELGLVYAIEVSDDGDVDIRLTLTSPMCPVAGSLPPEVEAKVAQVPGVKSSRVEVVWEPPWNPSMMSEAARLELGFD
jgi:FeS assembly SUF system protein